MFLVPRQQHHPMMGYYDDSVFMPRRPAGVLDELLDVFDNTMDLATQCEVVGGKAEVIDTDQKFGVKLDVSNFKPEDLSVQIVGDRLVVKGKHEERQDETGYITRQFTRSYVLPKNVDKANFKSSLTKDNTLMVETAKLQLQHQQVPIAIEKDGKSDKK